MNVLVVFEPAYAGSVSNAVWIIDSFDTRISLESV
jgi:hypothetical protein